MIEVDFSIIGDPTPMLEQLLRDFEREHAIHVNLSVQTWENAWHELLMWGLYGQGPDVSQVGSTWATSLMGMNAVRPFKENDIRGVGGPYDFLPQCWQSTQDPISFAISSLPWTAYTFVLAYRRDLFEQAGLNAQTAFQSGESLLDAVQTLSKSGVRRPWVMPVDPNYIDILHFVASWVWASGGDFISPDGRHVAFNRPATIDAMANFFSLLKHSQNLVLPMGEDDALDMFLRGEAAITPVGSGIAYTWLRNNMLSPELFQNIAFAPVPGIPWIGGDNLVIWKNARMTPQRESAALQLVTFLVRPSTQERYADGEEVSLPTLLNSLGSLPLPNHSLSQAVRISLARGRSYLPINLWGKVELQLARTMDEIAAQIVAGGDPAELVRGRMSTQASWLEMLLR